jgi:hypothetical protein
MQLHDRDRIGYRTTWTCEKWSEDAVDYSRKVLDAAGISHIPAELVPQEVAIKRGRINKLFSEILGRPMVELVVRPRLMPITEGISSQMLRALVGSPEEAIEIEGNLLLNEGIQRFMDMTMIATLTGTGWNNANAFLGVGDSSTAEAATQTELSGCDQPFLQGNECDFPVACIADFLFPVRFHFHGSELCLGRMDNFIWSNYGIRCGLHVRHYEPQPQGCGSRYEINGYMDVDCAGHILVNEIEWRVKSDDTCFWLSSRRRPEW